MELSSACLSNAREVGGIGRVRRALLIVVEMEREGNGLEWVGGEDGGVDVDVTKLWNIRAT